MGSFIMAKLTGGFSQSIDQSIDRSINQSINHFYFSPKQVQTGTSLSHG